MLPGLRCQSSFKPKEVLQLYDHLEEMSGVPSISDLISGILLLTSPAGAADLLRVDHLQQQCIQRLAPLGLKGRRLRITDAANTDLQNLMKSGRAARKTMEEPRNA